MTPEEFVKQMLIRHPAPWRHDTLSSGQIVPRDARQAVIQLLDLLNFATASSQVAFNLTRYNQ
jgi:hypothetical protein